MKKIFSVVVLMLVVSFVGFEANAQSALYKSIIAAKKEAEKMEQEGWKTEGFGMLEPCLIELYVQQVNGNVIVTGTSLQKESPDEAKNSAVDNACREIALAQWFQFNEVSQVSFEGDDDSERNTLCQIYDLRIDVKASLPLPTLVLYRKRGGRYDCQCIYAVPSDLLKARD